MFPIFSMHRMCLFWHVIFPWFIFLVWYFFFMIHLFSGDILQTLNLCNRCFPCDYWSFFHMWYYTWFVYFRMPFYQTRLFIFLLVIFHMIYLFSCDSLIIFMVLYTFRLFSHMIAFTRCVYVHMWFFFHLTYPDFKHVHHQMLLGRMYFHIWFLFHASFIFTSHVILYRSCIFPFFLYMTNVLCI